MSKVCNNSVQHPRFVNDNSRITYNDLLNAIKNTIEDKDCVKLEGLFEYAELQDLLGKIIELFHFDILYDLLDTQNLQLIKIALDRVGYNIITGDGETPITHEAFEGRLSCVKFLVKNGADVNLETSDGNFALYSSILNLESDNPNIKVFEYLYPLTSEDLQKDILEYLREHPISETHHIDINPN